VGVRDTDAMTEHRWDPQPGDDELIRKHLDRQRGLADTHVRLDDGRVLRVGADAEGEADERR
jgi:hypothetical protein